MKLPKLVKLISQAAFLALVLFARTGDAVFGLVEVDWLNDTIYLSPVQVMFLGIFLMFLSIIGFFQWGPGQASVIPQIGRALGGAGFHVSNGNVTENVQGINQAAHKMDYFWEIGKAMVMMDPGSCVREFICEYDHATNRLQHLHNYEETLSSKITGSRQK